jgi:hypothetical protein
LKRAKIGGGFAIKGHGVTEFEREARDFDRQLDHHMWTTCLDLAVFVPEAGMPQEN